MKVAIISEYNHFTSIGGTEYYVKLLIKGLCAKGQEVVFITQGKQDHEVVHKIEPEGGSNYDVYFLPVLHYSTASIRLQQVSESWTYLKPLLEKAAPDVIHVHTLTTFFNRFHFELCASICKALVFTSHVPEHYCAKGDLIQNGTHPCNGKVGIKCSVCLFTKSIKTGISNLLHPTYDKMLGELLQLEQLPVHLICVSNWQKKQLVRNGYKAANIAVVRQALSVNEYPDVKGGHTNDVFTVGYLGRLTKEKGATLLLQVLRKFQGAANIRFVLGVPVANSDATFVRTLKELISKPGNNIELMESVGAATKMDFFHAIDCLFIPSFFMETGPIVLLEAVLCGKKAVAPDVGGPLEFAAEFPDEVINYKWGSLDSALMGIKMAQRQNENIFQNMNEIFLRKKKEFLADQIKIYMNVSYGQKN